MTRGQLRIYLGSAPGVGKTYAMLNEGCRRAERGTDVVVACAEFHGRAHTAEQVRDLEVIPRISVIHRGRAYDEMDREAILARRPEVALVDEMAHSNIPGGLHAKRWQDIEDLLAAGINVISTVNIQHLESLNDVVADITGIVQDETVPDRVVRAADQIELVDMSPESLRRRMAHGNIYSPGNVNVALGNYFRLGNLAALRELALLWVADQVEEGIQDYRERHAITRPWETRERVVVAVTGSPGAERVIRRGARMAARSHADLVGVHIRVTDGMAGPSRDALGRHQALLAELGGRYAEVTGTDIATTLVDFATAENASQLLVGSTDRSRWEELRRGSVINQIIRRAGDLDVHVIANRPALGPADEGRDRVLPRLPSGSRPVALARRRVITGWILAVIGVPVLAIALVPARHALGPTGALPELLLGVVVVAAIGGVLPGLTAALLGFGFGDWFLISPVHSLTISRTGDLVALFSFVVVAAIVAALIDRLARRGRREARVRSEAEALARLAGRSVLAPSETLPTLVEELRATFALDAVAVLEPAGDDDGTGRRWHVQTSAGPAVPASPEEADYSAELTAGSVLVLSGTGSGVGAEDRPLLGAFVAQLRRAQDQQRLAETAASAEELAQANDLRAALLAAVSHDLRTPLASIKACATSLLSDDIEWEPGTARSFSQTIDTEADRLNNLIDNLLDMSRLQTGALRPATRPVGADEVIFSALTSLSGDTSAVVVNVPETLPALRADTALLERVVANIIANAQAWSPPAEPVRVEAAVNGNRMEIHVVDRGPGIPTGQREAVFEPFQRGGDTPNGPTDGVGLGLAVARGFVEAMAGTLTLEDTPAGGLTAIINLPLAADPPAPQRAQSSAPIST